MCEDNSQDMKVLKNNTLNLQSKKNLCKTHNGKKQSTQKVKLIMYKSYNHIKTYHPLKRKKIKLHKFKFVPNVAVNGILSRRYCITATEPDKFNKWSNEEEIISWLASVNIKVKRISSLQFILENKIYSFNYIVIFANKKRLELGLKPFYIEGITEY